ncbi:glycosyltransferase family 39 protein [Nocardia sp. CA-290969]|uniref:glycosyltransferase family 39 protein n=1 Tax=Nocardia sp. CA-290969 TaxID=3239986 RepID=UPI003D8EEE47
MVSAGRALPAGVTGAARHRDAAISTFAVVPVSVLAGAAGLLWLLRADRYPHFGDELYFLMAGRNLAVGYVDQGPVVALVARVADLAAPGSLMALRAPAVLAAVAAVLLTAVLAREFGGGTYAQVLAALAYATCPFALSQAAALSTFALEVTCSALVVWFVVRWARTRDPRLIPVALAVAALGLQIKWLALVVPAGLAAGIALAGPRALWRQRVLWVAVPVAALSALPGVVWQARHGWPQWAMGEVIRAEQTPATGGRIGLPGHQFVQAGVLGTVLVVAAIVGFLRYDGLRRYRFVAVAAAVALLFVVVTATRPYYTAALLPAVLAAGAVALTAWSGRWIRGVAVGSGVLAAALAVAAVLVLPLESADRPSDSAAQVYTRLRMSGTSGWPVLTATVLRAYRDLPANIRDRTVIVTDTYWQASGLEYLAGAQLPPVYSPNRGYISFGRPPDSTGSVLYVGSARGRAALCGHFRTAATVAAADDPLGFPGISRFVTVAHCAGPVRPWSEIWSHTATLALDMGVATGPDTDRSSRRSDK